MKKVFLIILLISILPALFCEGYRFSIEPFYGVRSGTLYEYSYYVQEGRADYKISQLEWHFRPAMLMGGTICSAYGPFEFSTTVLGMNHIQNGVLYDWDFENFDGKATKFSEHRAELSASLEASGNIAFRFNFDENFSLAPFAGINYNHMNWDAYDGYSQYAQGTGYWNENLPKTPVTGKVISYSNTMWYPTAGLQMQTSFFNFISIQAGFSASPYIYANSVDQHWRRDLEFVDTMRKGYGFFGDIKINVSFLKYHTFSFFASGQTIQNVKGKTELRQIGVNGQGLESGKGGTANTNYSFGFSYKLTID